MSDQPIIIIGAGIAGLSAAIRLQGQGYRTIIFEKNEQVGGKMYQIEREGFRFDTGPSVITMRHVFEDLFKAAGRRMSDYLTLEAIEPMTRYIYADGTVLDATSNLSHMAQQIEALDPRDLEGYLSYLAYAAQIHRVTGQTFIYDQPPSFASFLKRPVWDWLKADPFRTMHGAIQSFVHSEKLQQLLGRFATYVGGSPYQAPATLNVIAHVELTGGVWYPRGGIYQIARALERLALELGVVICRGQAVQQIIVRGGRAQGVQLNTGATLAARAILSNVDVATTYRHLLNHSTIPRARIMKMSHYQPSCSGFIMMLGVRGQREQLLHHNILFSADYRAEFEAIFKRGSLAQDPTIYIAITSKTDPDHAPPNCENWFVLVNAPALSQPDDGQMNVQAYRDQVLAKLAKQGLDIRNDIITETLWTPHDLQTMSGAWLGALYGPSANQRLAAFLRPHNRCRDVRGLYFAGGTTHPGGGVPMVVLSSAVAVAMMHEDGV